MRLWQDGAEFDDLLFWDTTSNITVSAANKRSGNYSYSVSSSSGKGFSGYKLLGQDLSEFYFRFAAYVSAGSMFPTWLYKGTAKIAMGWDVYGRPEFILGHPDVTAPTATGTNSRNPDFNLYEIYIKVADIGGRFVLYQNGIKEIDYTGDTKVGGDDYLDAFSIFVYTGTGIFLDDLALNDTTGGVDDSWCGDEHYALLVANDNGDVNNWTGSDGDKVDNFAQVDDIPPDGDTSFVYSDTALQQDMYKVQDFTATGKIVTRIYAECRARDSNATGGQIKIGFKTGGSVYLCTLSRTLMNTYEKIVGDDALVNPADSGIWEDADLDAIQFVTEDE